MLLVVAVYFPVLHFDFVSLDDRDYITNNEQVMSGLTMEGLRWAFTSTENANWFPLTRVSFMIDRQLSGPTEHATRLMTDAGPYHWTNLVLHALSTLLLYGLLLRLTGAAWPSALTAFLFALHPQHVESVAWVAERKDVLSTLFWMLALWSYTAYVKRPKVAPYLLALLFYCLGFMAKPMVVTLPAVFLLLDLWPLVRFSAHKFSRLLWEKAPFFALALAMSVATILVQRAGGAVRTFQQLSLGFRLENALVSAAVYIGKMFWPTRLAVFYPLPSSIPAWQTIAAGLVLGCITVLAILTVRNRPYLAAGWFWYLVTVLPVIGIVQVGDQMRADRYTYVPSIGLFVMLSWSGADLWRHWPHLRPVLAGVCATGCVAAVVVTWRQIPYWRNSESLFQHAIAVTDGNFFAHACLGNVRKEEGLDDDAISEYRQSLAIFPRNPGLEDKLGQLLYQHGRPAEAAAAMTGAVSHAPDEPSLRDHFGVALLAAGRPAEAVQQFEAAIRLKPDFWEAEIRLGNTLTSLGRTAEANQHFSRAFQGHAEPPQAGGK